MLRVRLLPAPAGCIVCVRACVWLGVALSAPPAYLRVRGDRVSCTVRRLQEDPTLEGVSHVIVDEAHERSADGDFLLMVLRRLLPRRPDLRVVLMSATLDAALFEGYFGGACRLTIPGRTFTVTPFFLEDCLEFTKHAISSSNKVG